MANVAKTNYTQATSPVDVERKKILAEANTEFLEIYTKIREQLVGEEMNIFRSRHKIGELLDDMRKEENKYGSKCVERMESAVGFDRTVIYNSLLFYERYTKDELDKLLALRNKADEPLLWTHVTHLIRIPDRTVRGEMTSAVLDNNLTPSELLALIHAKQGKARQSGAGKPLARPKSLKGFIDQQYTHLEQLMKRKNKVWAGVEKPGDMSFLDTLDNTLADKIDASLLTELERLEQLYEQSSLEMDSMAGDLLRRRKKIEREKDLAKRRKEATPKHTFKEEDPEENDDGIDDEELDELMDASGKSKTSRKHEPALD